MDSFITINKLGLGVVVVGIIDVEDFSINVVVVADTGFFFLVLRDRKALVFCGFLLKEKKKK